MADEPHFRVSGTRFDAWRNTTASGVVAAAMAFGMREALDPVKDEAAIVQEMDDELFGPERAIELHLEWGKPWDSWVVLRPWLLREGAA